MHPTAPRASRTTAPVVVIDRLGRLVARTATGDRAAFRCLYAFLAMPAWHAAVRGLPDPADAMTLTRSTFVEMWHLARHHTNDDTRAWLAAITARRIAERRGTAAAPGADADGHHGVVHRELHDLLGPGRATIRTSPRTFINIANLDGTLATIAATTGDRRTGPPRAGTGLYSPVTAAAGAVVE